ncbi:MAG: RsmB/NOP family class I SAM-dependent RNA methyltransferase [Clostridiales bacterium]|jgi:NOL1/NOP2/sun family putative RNA methylase|nr:RsmB/NOP family class I SAM-dependent RNA methyltransferase [Clostridiales bacterium]
MNLPQDFVANMERLFASPDEAAEFFASLKKPRHYGIRANELKISARDLAALFGNIQPVPWCRQGFYYTDSLPASKNPLYRAGLYYIQEPSAMSAAAVLDVQPGERVLDLCASPGGKSTQMASALGGRGLLVANDINYGRMPQLVRNMEMAGVKNAMILCEKPARLAERFPGYFQKILVDAPCSGEGMFRKDPEAIAAWDKNKSARLFAIQRDILRHAAKMLAVCGFLAYSTCTFAPTENEDVIEDFLESHPDFDSVRINHRHFGFDAANAGLNTSNAHAARIWPHRHRGEGHFIALLRRKGHTGPPRDIKEYPLPKFSNRHFYEFSERYFTNRPDAKILEHRGNLYALPHICPDVTGLNIVRLGVHLGESKKGLFAPSYALAMSLGLADFAEIIDLPPEDAGVAAYLGGQTFEIAAPDGYSLFCVAGHPLGFAKILNGRLKGRIL